MSENILFQDEIASSVLKVAKENKVVWKDIIIDMSDLIQQNYSGGGVKGFRGDWKRRIKSVVRSMGYKLVDSGSDFFVTLNVTKVKQASSSKSTDSNYILAQAEKERVLQMYNNIPQDQKWTLSTGKVVDDEMKKLVEDSIYEHPVHSMIFDPDDTIWNIYFTPVEINEIRSFHLRPLPSIPIDIQQYLEIYNKDWGSATDLYMFANSQVHNPITEFDYKWIRESIIRMSELFLYEDTLELNNYSEAELLHDVWPFVYRIFKEKGIKAMIGERCSVAVALARNGDRKVEAVERRRRKSIGSRVDILFKVVGDELGSSEIGKDGIMIADDKYINDGLVKLPKTLRDILSALIQKNPAQVNNLASVGFLMMGLNMELLTMDVPVGHHISRISRTIKFDFPSSFSTIAADFLPLLEVTWKGKEAMKSTVKILNDKKRKASELNTTGIENSSLLPCSFVRMSF